MCITLAVQFRHFLQDPSSLPSTSHQIFTYNIAISHKKEVNLHLWDVGGRERDKEIRKEAYQGVRNNVNWPKWDLYD